VGQSGNGGFVEDSGKEILKFLRHGRCQAPPGQTGTILLDLRHQIQDTGGADNGK